MIRWVRRTSTFQPLSRMFSISSLWVLTLLPFPSTAVQVGRIAPSPESEATVSHADELYVHLRGLVEPYQFHCELARGHRTCGQDYSSSSHIPQLHSLSSFSKDIVLQSPLDLFKVLRTIRQLQCSSRFRCITQDEGTTGYVHLKERQHISTHISLNG